MLAAFLVAGPEASTAQPAVSRSIPTPLARHPGNIFVEGQAVAVPLPSTLVDGWRLHDYDGKDLGAVAVRDGHAQLGPLPVGFYRLQQHARSNVNWISLGVLAPLQAPTPLTSPVALDVAMAWFYPKEKMDAVANLCALAGVNWVRDRLNWGHMEPQRGKFAGPNQYDASAHAQRQAGLQVLQVNHISPSWANPTHKRFPLDLRDAYRFHREMARRWQGQVLAFEPWNEADIPMFGGHTGSEMAAMQKAAYLGLKAGSPNVIACLNVFALHRAAQLEDLHDNVAWPYFDTFNLHHYEPFDQYPKLYADYRAVSAGKPLWVSECARPVKWAGDEKLKEPTDADLRVQAERMAKTFALSVHEGSVATFYFLLPHYVEGQTQFGLLRPDLTPRPGFVALAAIGRLMADARPLGRLSGDASAHAYFFQVRAGGKPRDLLVAWEEQKESPLALPELPEAVCDHLGRARERDQTVRLTGAPLFLLFPPGGSKKFPLTPPPQAPPELGGEPSPIVLQSLWPEDKVRLDKSAYRIAADRVETLPVWVYNFSERPVSGQLRVAAPDGWKVSLPATVELQPEERKELALTVDVRDAPARLIEKIRITGDFGDAGQPVLSVRLMSPAGITVATLPDTTDVARWQKAIAEGGQLRLDPTNGSVLVTAERAEGDWWVYPTLKLRAGEVPPRGTEGIGLTFTLLEGSGQFRVIFEEENGSAYVADFVAAPKRGEPMEAVAMFDGAMHGRDWSKPDPNGRLDAEQVRVIKIGCNPGTGKVQFAFKNLRWINWK